MLELHNISFDIVFPLHYMHKHLKICLRLGNLLLDSEFSLFVRIKKGAITSPIIYNNASLPAQIGLPISCISKGIDTSVLCDVDKLLDPCQLILSLQRSFDNLSDKYLQIGQCMNAESPKPSSLIYMVVMCLIVSV